MERPTHHGGQKIWWITPRLGFIHLPELPDVLVGVGWLNNRLHAPINSLGFGLSLIAQDLNDLANRVAAELDPSTQGPTIDEVGEEFIGDG